MPVNKTNNSVKTVARYAGYKKTKEGMDVKYYDGSKWQKTVFDNKDKFNIMAQDLTVFIRTNACKNGGKISSEDMLNAWLQTKSKNAPFGVRDMTFGIHSYSAGKDQIQIAKINELNEMIQTACQSNSQGGTYVTPEEQYSIMNALANWFTK